MQECWVARCVSIFTSQALQKDRVHRPLTLPPVLRRLCWSAVSLVFAFLFSQGFFVILLWDLFAFPMLPMRIKNSLSPFSLSYAHLFYEILVMYLWSTSSYRVLDLSEFVAGLYVFIPFFYLYHKSHSPAGGLSSCFLRWPMMNVSCFVI